MKIKLVKKSPEHLTLLLKDAHVSYVNSLRRLVMEETPIMAIEDVEIKKNNSILYDEMLSHRLGLLPLKTDPKGYELWEEDAPASAKNSVQLVLKSKGPGNVLASQFKSKDPKVVPVYPDMVLVKLLEGQEIELLATAVLGKGKWHTKWSGCLASYAQLHTIKTKDAELLKELESYFPKGKLAKKGDVIVLDSDNPREHDLLLSLVQDHPDKVTIEPTDDYLFTLESWGQLSPKDIMIHALKQFDVQLAEIVKLSKEL